MQDGDHRAVFQPRRDRRASPSRNHNACSGEAGPGHGGPDGERQHDRREEQWRPGRPKRGEERKRDDREVPLRHQRQRGQQRATVPVQGLEQRAPHFP